MTLPRLIFVTGKGGTGKSTVAAALALALSRRRPTTLAELDPRQRAAELLPQNDSLRVESFSAHQELESFIRRIVPIAAISRRMLNSRTFGYVTAALPGLEAFLLLERLRTLAGDAALEDRYVVVDAPASGTSLELLGVARGLTDLAPAGTLNRLASAVENFLREPELFGVALTLAPEQLALNEALETAAVLRDRFEITSVMTILNRAVDSPFTAAELDSFDSHPAVALARNRARRHASSVKVEHGLRRAGLHPLVLPLIFSEQLNARELARLSKALRLELTEQ